MTPRNFTWPVAVACSAIVAVQPAWAQAPQKKTLDNGLTVLVQENRAAPVVAVRFYVRTGSIYEGKYLGTGISHLFEHTLFEGTSTRSKQQINDDVAAIGGQTNAYTSKDVTCYYINTAAPYFEKALSSLSDMMRNATFPESEVKTQIGVIHNEMNLGEDDPDRELYQIFDEAAFKVHPTRYPIIGYRQAFDRLTRDDIVDYYKSHYEPGNVVLSVAGDVSSAAVFALAQKYLGDWERRPAQANALPDEPRQTTPRRAVVEKDVQLTQIMQGWHTVPLQHPDLYALDVLAEIMGGSESSRLVRSLRERQSLVTAISAYSGTPNYNGGIFGIRATLPPANLAKVEKAIAAEVQRIKQNGVTADELARAKRSVETAFVFNNTDVENQAEQIASDELATGDPAFSRLYVRRIQAVTAPQVLAVARKYLRPEGTTTAVIRPRGNAAAATASARSERAGEAKLFRLSNGMKLIVKRNPASPSLSIVAAGLGGTRLEPASKAGVASLTAQMLTRGTKQRSAEQIAAAIDALGGQMGGSSGYNSWNLSSQWLARDWRRGLSLVAESLLTPTFPADELARAKSQTISAIRENEDDPNGAASLLLRRAFYGAHPYGRSPRGSVASVSKISREDVARFWRSTARPQSTVLTVYGDVQPEAVRAAVEYAFKNWKNASRLPAAPKAPSELSEFKVVQQLKPGLAQTALWFGYPSTGIRDEDRFAVDVLDAALSGSSLPGGRLHTRLRDNQLVYVVHAYNSPGLDSGMFAIYANTTRENRERVQSIIEEEVARVRDAEISPEELERAKSMAIAAHAIENQTNGAQAQQAAYDELYGLGYRDDERYAARINRVTLADVRLAAQKYLRPGAAALAVVGPPGAQAPTAPVTTPTSDPAEKPAGTTEDKPDGTPADASDDKPATQDGQPKQP